MNDLLQRKWWRPEVEKYRAVTKWLEKYDDLEQIKNVAADVVTRRDKK